MNSMCERCRGWSGCLLNYNGVACKQHRKEYSPETKFTKFDRLMGMTPEWLAKEIYEDRDNVGLMEYKDVLDWLLTPIEEDK